ncbi:MAG TPA: DNA methyltransferase [Dehalococcoidia bacterium]|nr:DNA methyltransferase [Dehalococcoidia bacterium]
MIKFKRDTAFRKQFFVPDSFAHPAKMDAQLCLWITERYTKVGETILDPMAGMGTQMLACGLGRNVILVELEEKFCKMMFDNWEIVKMHPQLGYEMGACQIIQGDARNLEGLLVDKIITSPPYAETGASGKSRSPFWERLADDPTSARYGREKHPSVGEEYSADPNNIGNLPYGQIDKIVTSPPYEEAMGEKHHSPRADKLAQEKGNPVTYTDRVDKIITSPPYEASVKRGDESPSACGKDRPTYEERLVNSRVYSNSDNNIGNLKSQSYLEAMLQVYQKCHKVLKPEGGLLILVTKNFIRNKAVVRLDLDTIKLCEQAGFKLLERHYRKLPAQSFWRTIYAQKHPEVGLIDTEDILVFER